ncbi:MarR family winged helix-turn-helix transcriptional regulator [Actinoplanes aureus]|uniref:Uncharacterized protein n=1 Tax=Actinoplanes aureus TaxID=2792083 RepID=A0A931G2X7_9ACTN|nr:MarR family winged helix-turn-helix transcriptional regulator [Actinoplanes aureus]MBG0568227.1 hypothetical protein [Actinoplanes aureus]
MTDESRDLTTGESDQAEPANSNFAVLAAIAELGLGATPAAIAKKVGIAYSTVNPKLRAWETAGLAERFRHDTGQTLWRLTDAGRASTATPPQFADAATPPQPAPADSREITDGGDADETTPVAAPAPADSDTATPEPVTADAVGGDAEAAVGGGEERGSDNAAATTAGATAQRPNHPGTEPAPATPAPDETAEPPRGQHAGSGTPTGAAPAKRKRPKGALKASALAILQANPGSEYTIDQLKKLIDQADAGTGYPAASHGAVSNALDTLERDGEAAKVDDRKAATFTLAPTTD